MGIRLVRPPGRGARELAGWAPPRRAGEGEAAGPVPVLPQAGCPTALLLFLGQSLLPPSRWHHRQIQPLSSFPAGKLLARGKHAKDAHSPLSSVTPWDGGGQCVLWPWSSCLPPTASDRQLSTASPLLPASGEAFPTAGPTTTQRPLRCRAGPAWWTGSGGAGRTVCGAGVL